jgi:hypothetical protein
MQISGAISQLRTTDLAESVRFYTTKVGLSGASTSTSTWKPTMPRRRRTR